MANVSSITLMAIAAFKEIERLEKRIEAKNANLITLVNQIPEEEFEEYVKSTQDKSYTG